MLMACCWVSRTNNVSWLEHLSDEPLGTSMLCSLLNMGLSFAPAKTLKRIFPPVVTGTVIVMIGASLIGESGVLNWAGGANDCHLRPASGFFQLCPNISAPKAALWGSPQFIGKLTLP
jgi:uric acid-xanthine permease